MKRSKAVSSAQIYAFPPARHRKIVAYVVGQMIEQPTVDAAEEFLIGHLNMEWSRLADLGIADAEIEQHCHAFARAAWQIVFADRRAWGAA